MTSLLLCALPGCGGENFSLAPVSGTITLDGEPLADATIVVSPERASLDATANVGPGSTGTTNGEGQFTLTTIDGRDGAVVGKHSVIISAGGGRDVSDFDEYGAENAEKVPSRYNTNSTLVLEVPAAGTDTVKFELSSQADEPAQ